MDISLAQSAFSLLSLVFLEIVLGIDNLVFISIVSSRLPKSQQKLARRLGLSFALVTRILLLSLVFIMTHLTQPLFAVWGHSVSVRDLILFFGGVFLVWKTTGEIHQEVMHDKEASRLKGSKSLWMAIIQIGLLDIIFSLDSVITAIGMTEEFWIMVVAICIAILVMIFVSEVIHEFIEANPTIKMLALSFLVMIGMVLMADSFHYEIPRSTIYFTITFSLFVETLNTLVRRKRS